MVNPDRYNFRIITAILTVPDFFLNIFTVVRFDIKNELSHDKTKMACVPSEDSDQPGHLPSLIRVRCALSGELRTHSFLMQTAKTLIRLGRCPG